MESVIFKTKGALDSDLNLKWWIFKQCTTANSGSIYIKHFDREGMSIKIKVYNGTLVTGSLCTFIDSETVGEDTVNNYTVTTNNLNSDNNIRIPIKTDADKILVESGDWFASFGSTASSDSGYFNIAQVALHAPRTIPSIYKYGITNDLYMSYSQCYGKLEDILDVLPYYSGIRIQGGNISGNIEEIANYIEPENFPEYSSSSVQCRFVFLATINNEKLSGDITTLAELIKKRGKTDFVFEYSFSSKSKVTYPEGCRLGIITFDSNGNYTIAPAS